MRSPFFCASSLFPFNPSEAIVQSASRRVCHGRGLNCNEKQVSY